MSSVLPTEENLQQILDEAQRMALRAGESPNSGHVLLALLTIENEARRLLVEQGLAVDRVLRRVSGLEPASTEPEPPGLLVQIQERCRRVAQGCGSSPANALHLVIALAAARESAAYQLFINEGVDPPRLSANALALLRLEFTEANAAPRAPLPPAGSVAQEYQLPGGAAEGSPQPFLWGEVLSGAMLEAASMSPTEERATLRRLRMPHERRGGHEHGARRDPWAGRERGQPERDPWQARDLQPGVVFPEPRRRIEADRSNQPAGVARASEGPAPAGSAALDERAFPLLTRLGRNLSAAAASGQLDPVLVRRQLTWRILDILGRRRPSSPCLLGEGGVGKTALVHGLAQLQCTAAEQVPLLRERALVAIDLSELVTLTRETRAFAQLMAALRAEAERAGGRVVLFLDRLSGLSRGGGRARMLEALRELSPALARGAFLCLLAATEEDYQRALREVPLLERSLQPVPVPEPSPTEALQLLRVAAPAYARHHGVTFLPEGLELAIQLARHQSTERHLPDQALQLLDLAGSRARRCGRPSVGRIEVAEQLAEAGGLPLERLLLPDAERARYAERFLARQIVGQPRVLARLAQLLPWLELRLRRVPPVPAVLFSGPSGVGKRELAGVLADLLYLRRSALTCFAMQEYADAAAAARLFGAASDRAAPVQGGELAAALLRQPAQVLLLHGIEHAHRDVVELLRRLLDSGKLVDGEGRVVDGSRAFVVMTCEHAGEGADGPCPRELAQRAVESFIFLPLTADQLGAVARMQLRRLVERIEGEHGVSIAITEAAIDEVMHQLANDHEADGRRLRLLLQRLIEEPLAVRLPELADGEALRVDYGAGHWSVEVVPRSAS